MAQIRNVDRVKADQWMAVRTSRPSLPSGTMSDVSPTDQWMAVRTNDPRLRRKRWVTTRTKRPGCFSWIALGGLEGSTLDGYFRVSQRDRHTRSSVEGDYPWLTQVNELELAGRDDLALRIVYKTVNDWLMDQQFNRANLLLSHVQVEDISVDVLLALLTVTLRFHPKIPFRRSFFDRVKREFDRRGIHEDGVLNGLG